MKAFNRLPGVQDLDLHHLYRAMAFLGQPVADQPGARVLDTPRCTKDWIEEQLFEQRRDFVTGRIKRDHPGRNGVLLVIQNPPRVGLGANTNWGGPYFASNTSGKARVRLRPRQVNCPSPPRGFSPCRMQTIVSTVGLRVPERRLPPAAHPER